MPPVISHSACRVTLEYENGMVFTGIVDIAELVVESPAECVFFGDYEHSFIKQPRTWELTLRGRDSPYVEMPREEYKEQVIEPARTANEWKCDRCGAVWPRAENRCGACGFWRPFVYE